MPTISVPASASAQDQDPHKIGQLANAEFPAWPMRLKRFCAILNQVRCCGAESLAGRGQGVKKKRLFAGMVLTVLLAGCSQSIASPTATPAPEKASTVREQRVQAGDVTLHVRIVGEPDAGAVLIALHGGPGSASDYMLSLEQLACADLAIVTYDQRGTGQSTEPDEGYSMADYIADLEAVRQAVGAEQVHLFGHSWGGVVALRYAVAHPQQVKSIILMGSGVLTPVVAQTIQRNKAQRVAALQEQGIIPQNVSTMADLLPAYFSDPRFDMPDELENMYYSPMVEQRTWQALANYDFAAGLDRLEQPVLLLWGEDDPFGSAMAEATRDALAQAEVTFVVLEGCGHYWHECPAAFFAQVREFLSPPAAP
jgi:proline iminopeptidase